MMWEDFLPLNESEKTFKNIYLKYSAKFLGEDIEISQYNALIDTCPWLPRIHSQNTSLSVSSTFSLNPESGGIHVHRDERYVYPLKHSHEFIEIVCICHGKCRHFINNSYIEQTAGDICIIPPNVWHCVALLSDDSICFSIQVHPRFFFDFYLPGMDASDRLSRFINDVLNKDYSSAYLLFKTGGETSLNHLIISMYNEACHRRAYSKEMLSLELNQFFLTLIRDFSAKSFGPKPVNKKNQRVLSVIIEYMQHHYANTNLLEISEKFNYNKNYLSRLFKSYTGKTFSEILLIIKMRNARDLLLYTAMNIIDVGYAVGFSDFNYFFRRFKQYYGISPQKMRKNAEKKP